jgi:hypothetical protein
VIGQARRHLIETFDLDALLKQGAGWWPIHQYQDFLTDMLEDKAKVGDETIRGTDLLPEQKRLPLESASSER